MLIQLLLISLSISLLIVIHELAHIIAAKILGLTIQKVGVAYSPMPHAYVKVDFPRKVKSRLIYLFAGAFATQVLFFISYANNFFEQKYLYYAFLIQIAIEFNPFYSDFTIAYVSLQKIERNANFKQIHNNYLYSPQWYIHFILWFSILFLLSNLKIY
ncbi:hypothetical protein Fleli_1272 [Bernardetia litoralis DSM 6794]|uniref:Peptidase family M50 n=1 Tax=Bernardetia litoralis (strain ATCC 23117 / DSM 6794 / NBRC 15988 / NCIMB 1366 / Fx l1 / Sio-4) TaxID=880071 RepID=I4AIC1_BERLS|nr:hypothetical protein [Bernardetia litoralis]AFM03706.1 hypothetical protein Fleli_1272 [Bernardetia litoralis DSM 6794]